jgi:hypothetical protein
VRERNSLRDCVITFSNCSEIVPAGRQRAIDAPYECALQEVHRCDETKPLGDAIERAPKRRAIRTCGGSRLYTPRPKTMSDIKSRRTDVLALLSQFVLTATLSLFEKEREFRIA